MYQLYVIDEDAFDPKVLIGEYNDLDKARARAKKELDKDEDTKYVIEQTTGRVNNYGDLITEVIDQN